VIYEELVLGKLEEKSRATYCRVIADLVARGAQGIILGWTDRVADQASGFAGRSRGAWRLGA
jgi:aspartate/glutamate racemase